MTVRMRGFQGIFVQLLQTIYELINQVGTGFTAQGQDLSLTAQVLNDDFSVLK